MGAGASKSDAGQNASGAEKLEVGEWIHTVVLDVAHCFPSSTILAIKSNIGQPPPRQHSRS